MNVQRSYEGLQMFGNSVVETTTEAVFKKKNQKSHFVTYFLSHNTIHLITFKFNV